MATKKRLSDLVREEVQKQAEDVSPAETSTPSKSTKSKRATKRQTSPAATKKTTTAKAVESDELVALKTKIATLEKDNQGLKADNTKLLTKVESLERSVEKAKANETALKAAQSKQKSMLLTLDEAKQDALKLAQENQKLLDQIKALETQPAKPAAIAQRQPQKTRPQTAQSARSPVSHAIQRSSPTRPSPAIYKAPAKKPFSRPVAPSRLPIRRVVQNSDEFETWCYD